MYIVWASYIERWPLVNMHSAPICLSPSSTERQRRVNQFLLDGRRLVLAHSHGAIKVKRWAELQSETAAVRVPGSPVLSTTTSSAARCWADAARRRHWAGINWHWAALSCYCYCCACFLLVIWSNCTFASSVSAAGQREERRRRRRPDLFSIWNPLGEAGKVIRRDQPSKVKRFFQALLRSANTTLKRAPVFHPIANKNRA